MVNIRGKKEDIYRELYFFRGNMVYYYTCAVALCTNSSKNRPDLSFHLFPKDAKRRRVWKIFCRRADKEFISRHSSICKEHFKEDDFRKTLTGRVELKNTVNPSIFKPSAPSPTKIERNVSVKSKLQHPPRAFDAFSCPGGGEFDHYS